MALSGLFCDSALDSAMRSMQPAVSRADLGQPAARPLRLLLALDAAYEQMAAVAISSFLIHQRFESLWIVMPPGQELTRLQAIAAAFGTPLHVVVIAAESPIWRLLPSVSPYFYCVEAIDQVCRHREPFRGRYLYVDADTLCVAPLDDLANLELDPQKPLAACSHGRPMPDRQLILQLESGYHYFNAGVMLFDADLLAPLFSAEVVVRTYETHQALCRFREQCALNLLLRDRVQYLPNQFNLLSWMRARAGHHQWHDLGANPMAYILPHVREQVVIAHLSAGALPPRLAQDRLEALDHYWLRLAAVLEGGADASVLSRFPAYSDQADG